MRYPGKDRRLATESSLQSLGIRASHSDILPEAANQTRVQLLKLTLSLSEKSISKNRGGDCIRGLTEGNKRTRLALRFWNKQITVKTTGMIATGTARC